MRTPRRSSRSAIVAAALLIVAPGALGAQRGRGGQAAPAGPARDAAPVDLTGYWISVVTEDWRYRMVTPARGDFPSVPLNAAGATAARSWDPAKDDAAGQQCRAFGAAGVMRLPGRLHITWQDENTLKMETEAGTQTRLLRFGARPGAATASAASDTPQPGWQGESDAQWEQAGGRRGGRGGSLKVVTTRMRPGYLQKNGVPYSANALLTEYFSRTLEPNGDSWLILTAIVEDQQYLSGPFIRSTHYKRLPDANTAWEPEPCTSR